MDKYNARLMAILALGSEARIKNDIRDMYQENELYYYEKFRESELKDDQIKELYPASNLETINMLIGIFEDAYSRNDFCNIDLIIRIFNSRIFKFIKNKTLVDVDEFLDKEFFKSKHRKKVGDGICFDEGLNENEVYNVGSVLIYSAIRNGLNLTGVYFSQTIKAFDSKIDMLLVREAANQPSEQVQIIMDEIKEYLHLSDVFIDRQTSLGTFLDNLIEYKVEEILVKKHGLKRFQEYGASPNDYNETRNYVFSKGILKYIGALTIATSMFNIESNLSMSIVPINSDIINKILFACAKAEKGNKIPREEIPLLFIAEIFIYSIAYHYDELKYSYIYSEKDRHFDDVTKLRESLTEKYDVLERKEIELNWQLEENSKKQVALEKEFDTLQKELSLYKKKCEKQEKEIESLTKTIKNYKDQEMVWNDLIVNDESETATEDMLSILKTKRIAIFGGNKSTIKQLKGLFDNLLVFETNTKDISSIKNCDMIFINHQWINHSLTYKIWSEAKKTETPISYLSGTNINQIINQMFQFVNKKK